MATMVAMRVKIVTIIAREVRTKGTLTVIQIGINLILPIGVCL